MNTRSARRNTRKYLLVILLALTPATRAADRERVKEVAQGLMCICGCNQVLASCNHLGCTSSQPMLAEVGRYLDQGMSDDQVIAAFVEKYGMKALSAPPTTGAFNLSAWLMPFVALLVGATAIIFFLRKLKSATVPVAPAGPDDSKYRQRIEEELEKYNPED